MEAEREPLTTSIQIFHEYSIAELNSLEIRWHQGDCEIGLLTSRLNTTV